MIKDDDFQLLRGCGLSQTNEWTDERTNEWTFVNVVAFTTENNELIKNCFL